MTNRTGFLLVNPHSGSGGDVEELLEAARERALDVHVLAAGDDPVALAENARADVLGVAGGDGSLARTGPRFRSGPVLQPSAMWSIVRLHLLVALGLLSVAVGPALAGQRATPRTVDWARSQTNADVAVDLHDYYGLTLRFVSAHTGASCTGVGAATTGGVRRWWRFRCTTHLRGNEGTEFPGVVAVTLTLRVPPANGDRPAVSNVHVTSCAGKACPVH